MDFSKKRKMEENGTTTTSPPPPTTLTPEDGLKILSPLTQDNLLSILSTAMLRHPDVLDSVRSFADTDTSLRKLFIRGLSLHTTSDALRSLFSLFGPLDEAIVIADKSTGKSKGYGFITFRHVDSAVLALKEPSKLIDGRITVTQLAAAGMSKEGAASGGGGGGGDVSVRKIYVANVPAELSAERLLSHFLMYGEIEEGPLGFDKVTGKSRGFAFFVYKSEEGAKASLVDATKSIDGHQVVCKLAVDYKKTSQHPAGVTGNGVQQQQQPQLSVQASVPASLAASQYGAPSGFSSYGGFSGGQQGPPALPSGNYGLSSSLLSSRSGGYGAGYGGLGGEFGGLGNAGSSMYQLPPSSVGMPSGGYLEGGRYGVSSFAMPGQHPQPFSLPRVPPGGMYQGMPPYY